MSTENKSNARRWFEDVFSQGNMNAISELIAPEYVNHDPNVPGGAWQGLEGAKALIGTYRTAFPDVQFSIDHQIAENDLVMTRWTARGTHTGTLGQFPISHKPVVITGTNLKRIVNGKTVEEWANFDMLGLLRQIGVFPSA